MDANFDEFITILLDLTNNYSSINPGKSSSEIE
jgi:hypothetical protein